MGPGKRSIGSQLGVRVDVLALAGLARALLLTGFLAALGLVSLGLVPILRALCGVRLGRAAYLMYVRHGRHP